MSYKLLSKHNFISNYDNAKTAMISFTNSFSYLLKIIIIYKGQFQDFFCARNIFFNILLFDEVVQTDLLVLIYIFIMFKPVYKGTTEYFIGTV